MDVALTVNIAPQQKRQFCNMELNEDEMQDTMEQVVWTPKFLNAFRADVDAKKIPVRSQITDGLVPGLRARFEADRTAFYAHYFVAGERKQQLIGHFPEMSIPVAREVVKTIKALADKGINIQDGLVPRLIQELIQLGDAWRPDGWVFNPTK
jgi:hypothetical protein